MSEYFDYLNESGAPFRKVLAVLVGLVVSPCVKVDRKLLEIFNDGKVEVGFT